MSQAPDMEQPNGWGQIPEMEQPNGWGQIINPPGETAIAQAVPEARSRVRLIRSRRANRHRQQSVLPAAIER